MVATAAVVVVSEESVQGRIGSEFGHVALEKVFVSSDGSIVTGEVLAAVRSAVGACKQDQPRLGPRAAFVTCKRIASIPSGANLFVALGSERTGSMMFVSTFGADDLTRRVDEILNPRQAEPGHMSWLAPEAEAHDELRRLHRDDPSALLRQLCADAGANELRWIAFKLRYSRSVIDNRLIDALAADPCMPIVHLQRADRTGRALFELRAKSDDVWTSSAAGETRPSRSALTIDVREVIAEMTECEVFEERHAAVFADHPTINVDNEELCSDQATLGARLKQLLKTDLLLTHPRTLNTGRPLRESVANYTELREALKGTSWELGDHGRFEPRQLGKPTK